MTEPDLLYRVKNHVATFTINRESRRNAISPAAITLFHQGLDAAEKDDEVRVVCITGAGERAFCSGADLGSGIGGDDLDIFQEYARLITRLATFPKPTVARINGYCLAGGTGFMLACDVVIAKETAKFGTPEVNVGLFPMMIGALIFRNVAAQESHGDDHARRKTHRCPGPGNGHGHPRGGRGGLRAPGPGGSLVPGQKEPHRYAPGQGGLCRR